jgi:hypothetical protein
MVLMGSLALSSFALDSSADPEFPVALRLKVKSSAGLLPSSRELSFRFAPALIGNTWVVDLVSSVALGSSSGELKTDIRRIESLELLLSLFLRLVSRFAGRDGRLSPSFLMSTVAGLLKLIGSSSWKCETGGDPSAGDSEFDSETVRISRALRVVSTVIYAIECTRVLKRPSGVRFILSYSRQSPV